ncbi:DNA repair protein RadC [Lunatimonas lonarensis]|uniref:DNA repair protein RadC n=1 Tax=Lunatimonas lonarensis TaxID=1232681 RepID=R7ZP36_9BACT|nr:DNA repair protein RadC [Lunatimonas lonarensis]EON75847.1 DNA repair protein RadC [Lunatimonas lonarensis]
MDHFSSIPISHLAEEDRPREKLLLKGKSSLTDAELIAILIGSGTRSMSAVDLSKHILRSVNNDLSVLARLTVKDLQKFKGIGEAKAIAIVSALELGRRRKEHDPQKKNKIQSSGDVYHLMKAELMDETVEYFYAVLLNRQNQVIRKQLISQGGSSATVVDPKVVFKQAMDHFASAVILVHNHPSGQLKPSEQDLRLTRRLVEAGKSLELPVIDHVIFTDVGYFSFSDEGLI